MPLPIRTDNPTRKHGPDPDCLCGICKKCKSRERQRRFRERHLVKLKIGNMIQDQVGDDEDDEAEEYDD